MGSLSKLLTAMALVLTACGAADAQAGPGSGDQPGDLPAQTAAECPVTMPAVPGFVPPDPYSPLPPDGHDAVWYGTDDLWTTLNVSGEFWDALPPDLTQKTFWWSRHFVEADEPQPAITVTGSKVDDPSQSFSFTPGTNGTAAGLGSFMVVGIEFPSDGCWTLTASYGDASLTYVVEVEG